MLVDTGGVLGGMGNVLADDEDAAAAESGQRAVVEVLAVRDAFARIVVGWCRFTPR